jgi:hypothetical protein
MTAHVNDTNEPPERGQKLYIVALTERYEVEVWAHKRSEAAGAVDNFGGNSPVDSKVTVRLKNRPDPR